jgi:hypothetical protein
MGPMTHTAKTVAAVLAFTALSGGVFGAGVTATLKGGYFAPSNEIFREVYSGGPVFGADLTVPVGGPLRVWAGLDLFGKTGKLTLSEEETKVRIVPLYLGLRGEFGKTGLRPYVGAAAAYFLFHEENVLGTVSDGGLGFLTQAGVLLRIGGRVWLDLHAGYRGCTLTAAAGDPPIEGEEPLKAKLDGFHGGLGLAFRF